ncbi:MAG: hypothetical protein ACR2GD_03425 [Pyrinomonadaceae bacterium]
MKVLKISVKSLLTAAFILSASASISFGQQPRKSPTPTVVTSQEKKDVPLAKGSDLYCAGYIQNAPVNTNYEIVGAENEREQNVFQQGNYVYIGRGANGGVRVGDMFSVIRPRGKFRSKFSKKGNLGIYVQEIGAVEIVQVRPEVSVARVKTSCEAMMFGDLLQPIASRVSPLFVNRPALDLFGAPSGKASGRIVLARDEREAPTRNEIVYIDLGAEDNVKVGDYLTIYRPLGTGGVLNYHQDDTFIASSSGFESKRYQGGKFSNNAPRRAGSNAEGDVVTYNDVKKRRPQNLRKVVGEMVILNVKERTATALITSAAQEIHTGDMVEIQ